jgi:hypothetical protein
MKTLLAETFEQIVAAQQDRVLADTGEAEEAVQDTFMKFHRHWGRVPHRARRVSRGSAALGRGKSRVILITRAGKSRDYAAGYRRVDDAVGPKSWRIWTVAAGAGPNSPKRKQKWGIGGWGGADGTTCGRAVGNR